MTKKLLFATTAQLFTIVVFPFYHKINAKKALKLNVENLFFVRLNKVVILLYCHQSNQDHNPLQILFQKNIQHTNTVKNRFKLKGERATDENYIN